MSAVLYGGLAALQLVGGYYAAQNIRETARLNEDIAETNAQYAELDAFDAEIAGFTQQALYQNTIDQTLADQQLTFAVQDVDINFGSAADVVKETKFIAELNKMEIEKQAQEVSLGYEKQARDFRLGSFMNNLQAQSEASAVQFNAITSAAKTGLSGYARSN